MTSRENFMKLYHHEPAEFVPADGPYDIIPVPGEHGVTEKVGDEALDWFGQSWSCTEAVGILADTPTPGKNVLNDISEWKEKDVIPFHMIDEFDGSKLIFYNDDTGTARSTVQSVVSS